MTTTTTTAKTKTKTMTTLVENGPVGMSEWAVAPSGKVGEMDSSSLTVHRRMTVCQSGHADRRKKANSGLRLCG